MKHTNRIFTFLLALMLSCSGDSLFEVDPQNESPDIDDEISSAKRVRGINQIMIHTDRDGNHEIYVISAEGQTNLTQNPAIQSMNQVFLFVSTLKPDVHSV